ncbi:MAG: hypothetical protein JWQ74_3541 [Marmoricola sp.]|nr:hypothetical protein [Marmoricola sp.]
MSVLAFKDHPIHKQIFDDAKAIGTREELLLKTLDRARARGVRADLLISALGLDVPCGPSYRHYNFEKFNAAVRFGNVCARLNQLLRRHGWQLCRSGEAHNTQIWISKQLDSSG